MRRAYRTAGRLAGIPASMVQLGSLLNYLIRFGFWSLESDSDYYASLEDGTPYYSITEKE